MSNKPLGLRAYGHIPHLPGSRMGPSDHHCEAGQARIATFKTRDSLDKITVTVKLDGSCMAVANVDGAILALGRAGHLASSSPYPQHSMFADWVERNKSRFEDALQPGERFVGEWLAQAHGTRYRLRHEPFAVFDLMCAQKRAPYIEMRDRASKAELVMPCAIRVCGAPLSIAQVADWTLLFPMHGERDPVEGAVWRVERNGAFDFMAKWVRPDKIDGKYLPEISGSPAVWNWQFDTARSANAVQPDPSEQS